MNKMGLTRQQKNYLKKNIKRFPLTKLAADLNLPETDILKYLKKRWRPKKYQKFIQEKSKAGQNKKTFLFLTLLVLITYVNSLTNDFVADDISGIVQNENLLRNLDHVFSQPFAFTRPLIYFIAYKIGNLNPAIFRSFNLIFHLGTVWLVFLILCLLAKPPLALFTAGVFAVHPILTESVTWISGGVYSQYSFFFLLSFLAYLLYEKNKKLYFLSLLFFILALSSSEKAAVLLLVFPLFEISIGKWRQHWQKLVPFFALSGIWGLSFITLMGQRATTLEQEFYLQPGIENPLIQIPIAITSYLELLLYPKNLTLYHSEMIFSQTEYFFRLLGFIFFLATIAFFWKKDRKIFFWLSFFFISLLPFLTPLRISWIVAERYVYLGSLGIFVLVALGLKTIGKIIKNQKVSYVLFAIILLTLSLRTITRNADWKNQDTLWLATAKTSPSSPQNHNNLGDLYARRGELEKAVEEFKRAIALKPNYGDAYHNLANTYQKMGKNDLAIENYQKALSFNPNLWQSHQNLAVIYFKQGKMELVKQELEKVLQIDPQNQTAKQLLPTLP